MPFRFIAIAICALSISPTAAAATALTAAQRDGAEAWRSVATRADRARLREWRSAWVTALTRARAGGHGAEIAREGALLDPDAALRGVTPPRGDYRCRTIKIGAQRPGLLDWVSYPTFRCRIGGRPGRLTFAKLTGSQRPIGQFYADNDRRMVFLGTMQLGDERQTLRYGVDSERDSPGLLERVGPNRWRLVFPHPTFESVVDVLELVPVR